jgi:tRNA (guanine-N7-)-methyltransferase
VPKKKLVHFTENLSFPHLFQPKYQDLIPRFRMKSLWGEEFFHNQNPIILELGCGKGEYTVALGAKYPEMNFIGIDLKGSRLWRGCKTVAELGLKNVAFVRTQVNHLPYIFDQGEVSGIWITFPDPQPKRERKRLTAPPFIEKYLQVLRKGGVIHLKTDDPDFFAYTLDVIKEMNLELIYETTDLYHSGYEGDVLSTQTYYENIWLEKGRKICYLKILV